MLYSSPPIIAVGGIIYRNLEAMLNRPLTPEPPPPPISDFMYILRAISPAD
jgi:hypothetical protein